MISSTHEKKLKTVHYCICKQTYVQILIKGMIKISMENVILYTSGYFSQFDYPLLVQVKLRKGFEKGMYLVESSHWLVGWSPV